MNNHKPYLIIRGLIIVFMLGLVVSGLTAFPLHFEINILNQMIGQGTFMESLFPGMAQWITTVTEAINAIHGKYRFIFYGTDWLAFAHIIIAIAFIGPLRDPIKNIWVLEFGMIACGLLIPMALICGPLRGLPLFWIIIDCSFGIFGMVPISIAYMLTRQRASLDQGVTKAPAASGV